MAGPPRNVDGNFGGRSKPVYGGTDYSQFPFSLAISDPSLDDNPLVYVSPAFEQLTGYISYAVLGKNCRFLQGEKTDQETVKRLGEAISEGRDICIDIYNYRATGEGFWNRLLVGPIKENGEIRYHLAIQHEVSEKEHHRANSDAILAELQHRVKNHLAMVVSLIRVQASEAGVAMDEFSTLARRVEALQLLYQELSDGGIARHNDDIIPLGAYISRVASGVSYASGREAIRLNIDTEQIDASTQIAGQVGLILSELMTNSFQHGFQDRDRGVIEISLSQLTNGVIRLRVSDDGDGIPEELDWPNNGGLGGKIVKGLSRDIGGKLSVDRGATGTTVTLDVGIE